MTPLEMIAEWRKGCSNASPEHPEVCSECTRALIDALERRIKAETAGGVRAAPIAGALAAKSVEMSAVRAAAIRQKHAAEDLVALASELFEKLKAAPAETEDRKNTLRDAGRRIENARQVIEGKPAYVVPDLSVRTTDGEADK